MWQRLFFDEVAERSHLLPMQSRRQPAITLAEAESVNGSGMLWSLINMFPEVVSETLVCAETVKNKKRRSTCPAILKGEQRSVEALA